MFNTPNRSWKGPPKFAEKNSTEQNRLAWLLTSIMFFSQVIRSASSTLHGTFADDSASSAKPWWGSCGVGWGHGADVPALLLFRVARTARQRQAAVASQQLRAARVIAMFEAQHYTKPFAAIDLLLAVVRQPPPPETTCRSLQQASTFACKRTSSSGFASMLRKFYMHN